MGKYGRKSNRKEAEIVGLIDVVFILLVFFLVIIVPGAGGGDPGSRRVDLPKMEGIKPSELLNTLTFRVEYEESLDRLSTARPNVVYALLPYRNNMIAGQLTYFEALEQAKADTLARYVLEPQRGPGWIDEGAQEFVANSVAGYRKRNKQINGVMVSAITNTPFGLISYISNACSNNDVVMMEFRTRYP